MRIVIALVGVVAALLIGALEGAAEPAYVEVSAGLGTASTRLEFPYDKTYDGGGSRLYRANLFLPASPTAAFILGYAWNSQDFGYYSLDGSGSSSRIYSGRNQASLIQVGLRVYLGSRR